MHPMQRSSRRKDGRAPGPRAPLPDPEPPAGLQPDQVEPLTLFFQACVECALKWGWTETQFIKLARTVWRWMRDGQLKDPGQERAPDEPVPAGAEQLTLANVQAKLAQMGGRPLGFSPDTIYDPDLRHLPTRLATILRAAAPPLDATARHVLLAMFVSPTMHGVYDPAPRGAGAALAELTGHSTRSCWEALKVLEELGYVHVDRRGRGPHRYWLGAAVLQGSASPEEVSDQGPVARNPYRKHVDPTTGETLYVPHEAP